MIKRNWIRFIAALCAGLMLLGATALAEGEVVSLSEMALITEEAVYYSGSIDGVEAGIFKMDLDGANPVKIYDEDVSMLSLIGDTLMIYDWNLDKVVLINGAGEKIAEVSEGSGMAYSDGLHFYLGNLQISPDGAKIQELFQVKDAEDFWHLQPMAVDGGYLYYLDRRAYGMYAYEFTNTWALYRVPLEGGTAQRLVDEGMEWIGMDEEFIYYNRMNFSYFDQDTEEDMSTDFEEGLYKIAKGGGEPVKLAEIGAVTEDSYVHYSLMEAGVIYGYRSDFSNPDETAATLLRIGADGVAQPEVFLEDGSINAIDEGILLVTTMSFTEGEEFIQDDKIVAIDLQDMSRTVLNPDERYMLYYTEADPELAAMGGRVYFTSYDEQKAASGFFAANLDGSGVIQLAVGMIFE